MRFRSAAALVNELQLADKEHRLPRLLKQWRSTDLFIVDELGYIPFNTAGAQVLFQFFADRAEVASVAISSNLEFGRFTEVFHDERMTAALLDRLTFKSTVIVTKTIHTLVHNRRAQMSSSSFFPSTPYTAAA